MKKRNKNWDRIKARMTGVILLIYGLAIGLTPLLAGGASNTYNITGQITVPNTCTFVTSNAAIAFGTLTQGTNTIGTSGAYNVITVTNTGGNPSNILTSASNWNYNANTFKVSNTIYSTTPGNNLWSPAGSPPPGAGTANVETIETGSSVDTLLYTSNGATTNSLAFGANVPSGTAGSGSGVYSQTINIISSC